MTMPLSRHARPACSASKAGNSRARPRSIRTMVSNFEAVMRIRMNVYMPPELMRKVANLADQKGLSRSAIVEAAVASFLSPDGSDRMEAAVTRRLDRLTRHVQRSEEHTSEL